MRRYYALLLVPGRIQLVRVNGEERVLAEADFPFELGRPYGLSLRVEGSRLQAGVDGRPLFELRDKDPPLAGGGVALICEEGCVWSPGVEVRPLRPDR
jgi:hypothetical protein